MSLKNDIGANLHEENLKLISTHLNDDSYEFDQSVKSNFKKEKILNEILYFSDTENNILNTSKKISNFEIIDFENDLSLVDQKKSFVIKDQIEKTIITNNKNIKKECKTEDLKIKTQESNQEISSTKFTSTNTNTKNTKKSTLSGSLGYMNPIVSTSKYLNETNYPSTMNLFLPNSTQNFFINNLNLNKNETSFPQNNTNNTNNHFNISNAHLVNYGNFSNSNVINLPYNPSVIAYPFSNYNYQQQTYFPSNMYNFTSNNIPNSFIINNLNSKTPQISSSNINMNMNNLIINKPLIPNNFLSNQNCYFVNNVHNNIQPPQIKQISNNFHDASKKNIKNEQKLIKETKTQSLKNKISNPVENEAYKQNCLLYIKEITLHTTLTKFLCSHKGCKELQNKITIVSKEISEYLINQLIEEEGLENIMTNPYSNYIFQKFYDKCDASFRVYIIKSIKNFKEIANTVYGSHSLQFMVCCNPSKLEINILQEIASFNFKELSIGSNSYHLVIKCLENFRENQRESLNNKLISNVGDLAMDVFGVSVVSFLTKIKKLFSEASKNIQIQIFENSQNYFHDLILNPYGNYFIQFILEHTDYKDRKSLAKILINNILEYSLSKYSSNVIFKFFETSSRSEKKKIIEKVLNPEELGQHKKIKGLYMIVNKCVELLPSEEVDIYLTKFKSSIKCQYVLDMLYLKKESYSESNQS